MPGMPFSFWLYRHPQTGDIIIRAYEVEDDDPEAENGEVESEE